MIVIINNIINVVGKTEFFRYTRDKYSEAFEVK